MMHACTISVPKGCAAFLRWSAVIGFGKLCATNEHGEPKHHTNHITPHYQQWVAPKPSVKAAPPVPTAPKCSSTSSPSRKPTLRSPTSSLSSPSKSTFETIPPFADTSQSTKLSNAAISTDLAQRNCDGKRWAYYVQDLDPM